MNESARRDFVRSVIGGGVIASAYAAAVMPTGDLLAQIQRTDSEGLKVGSVMIPTSGGFQMPAYHAMPADGKPKAVLLVVHEVWVCMSTFKMFAADLPSRATSQLRPNSSSARAM